MIRLNRRDTPMKHALRAASIAGILLAGSSPAFAGSGLLRAIAFDNLHIRVPDTAKAAEWYVAHLGATPAPSPWRVYFGRTVIVFVKTEHAPPSAGSVIDHFGVAVNNVAAKVKELESAGAKVLAAPEAATKGRAVFVEDPWGVKIEILSDTRSLGFHHVHLKVADPKATLLWYQEMFGGAREKLKDRIEGLRYENVLLLAEPSGPHGLAASADCAIQLIAWQIPNRDEAVTALKTKQVAIVNSGVSKVEGQPVPWAFVDDPNGVRIELLQRPPG
jgi:catechol 2,3-dioxygenase-like lactoylglutathione lyase family enzyme